VVNRVRSTTVRSPRVYTKRAALLLLLVLTLAAGRARADDDVVDLTADPAMMKGAKTAAVTIVEFFDYQ
jgi:protein-disulfide isomerase